MWIDVSDLNRLLLHNNLPGLESLGRQGATPTPCRASAPTARSTWCASRAARRATRLSYDTCESCGGVFLESEFKDVTDFKNAEKEIVDFFKAFSNKGNGRRRRAG